MVFLKKFSDLFQNFLSFAIYESYFSSPKNRGAVLKMKINASRDIRLSSLLSQKFSEILREG